MEKMVECKKEVYAVIKMNDVEGENKGKIVLYALSTCGWCGKTKKFLNETKTGYSFVDVDLLSGAEKEEALEDIKRWNIRCSFPTVVINNSVCIIGYDTQKILEALS